MSNWAVGLNSALSSGLQTWNALSAFRSAATAANADAESKDIETKAKADVGAYTDAADLQKNKVTFGTMLGYDASDKEGLNRAWSQAEEAGLIKGNNVDYDKAGKYFGIDTNAPTPASDDAKGSAIPVATSMDSFNDGGNAPSEAPKVAASMSDFNGDESGQGAISDWRNELSDRYHNRDENSAQARAAVDEDLSRSIAKRFHTMAQDQKDVWHKRNRWFDPDAIKNEDAEAFNREYKALASYMVPKIEGGDGTTANLVMRFANMNNPNQQLVANGNGTYSVVDAQGKVLNANFKPSADQLAGALRNWYQNYRFFHTGDVETYTKQALDAAKLSSEQSNAKEAAIKAQAAETFGMKNAAAENRGKEATADGLAADAKVKTALVGANITKGKAGATEAVAKAQKAVEEAKATPLLNAMKIRSEKMKGDAHGRSNRGGSGGASPGGSGGSGKIFWESNGDGTFTGYLGGKNGEPVVTKGKNGMFHPYGDADGRMEFKALQELRGGENGHLYHEITTHRDGSQWVKVTNPKTGKLVELPMSELDTFQAAASEYIANKSKGSKGGDRKSEKPSTGAKGGKPGKGDTRGSALPVADQDYISR